MPWNDKLRRELAIGRLQHALHVLALLADHPDTIDSSAVQGGIETTTDLVEGALAIVREMAQEGAAAEQSEPDDHQHEQARKSGA